MSTLEEQLEARYLSEPLREALADAGDMSVQEAAALAPTEALPADLVPWRDEIVQAASTVRAALRDAWVSHDPTTRASPHFHEPDPELRNLPVDTGEFCDPDSLQSKLSPARYLMQIYRTATTQIHPTDKDGKPDEKRKLDTRRPDLKELALTSDHLLTDVTTLSLANQVMEALAGASSLEARDELYKTLATNRSAFSLPFDWYQTRVRLGLAVLGGASLNSIARATDSRSTMLDNASYTLVPNVRDRLGLCDEDMKVLTETDIANRDQELWVVNKFLDHTSLSLDELNLLICSSGIRSEASPATPAKYYARYIHSNAFPAITIGTTSSEKDTLILKRNDARVGDIDLGNMERMVRLYQRTGLPFHQLDHLICTAAQLEVRDPPVLNDFALSLIARYREWHARFGLSVDAYVGLLYWSNAFVREGFQETSYLRQLFGDDATWIAKYCEATTSEERRYLRKPESKVLTANEIAALQRGLQLTQTDWDTIVQQIDPRSEREFDSPCLAALQRFALPFRSFGWSIQDAVRMLKQIAPSLLSILSGLTHKNLPDALDQLAWLNDTLTAWQATPAQIATIVQTPPNTALQATQETANWINDLHQNLLPALLTASSFDAYQTVPLDSPTDATSTVTIDWLVELRYVRALDVNRLVLNLTQSEFESKVRTVLFNKGASRATSVQEGVVATLQLAQASATAILSAAMAKLMSGASDVVIPMLAWMNLDDPQKNPIDYYTVLNALLAWNLFTKRAIDVATLNQRSGTLKSVAFMSRYAEAVRLFRLEKEDIRLVVDRPVAFDARAARGTLKLDFDLLLALGQLKGLQHGQASADAWRMYFTRQATVGNDSSRKAALTDTLSQLLGCPVDELTLMLDDLSGPAGTLPDTIQGLDLMQRHLVQARALALDYAQLKSIKTMATRTGYGLESGSRLTWADKRTAADAVMTGVARYGASASAVEHPLDEACRDALVGYLLKKILPDKLITNITNAEQLYSYLLLDVNVSSEVTTTQLLEAISSVQLYINRALEGAEPATFRVGSERSDTAKRKLVDQWAIDREYRLWQANQELALFPAHYVAPERIQGASSDYAAFIEALNQGRLEDDVIRQALTPYLTDLSSRGRATIGGLSQMPVPGAPQSVKLYVTARTPGDAGDWYLRTLTLTPEGPQDVGPWEKIDVAIPRQSFSVPTPIEFKGAIYVVWAECDERSIQALADAPNAASVAKEYRYRVKRARRREPGRWDESEALPIQKQEEPDSVTVTIAEDREIISPLAPNLPCRFSSRWLKADQWCLSSYVPLKFKDGDAPPEIAVQVYVDSNLFAAQVGKCYAASGTRDMIVAVMGLDFVMSVPETETTCSFKDPQGNVTKTTKVKINCTLYSAQTTHELKAPEFFFAHHVTLVDPDRTSEVAIKKVELVLIKPSPDKTLYTSNHSTGWYCGWIKGSSVQNEHPSFKISLTHIGMSCELTVNLSHESIADIPPLHLLPGDAASDPCFVSAPGQEPSLSVPSILTWLFDNYINLTKTYAATDGSSPFIVKGDQPKSVLGPLSNMPAIQIEESVEHIAATVQKYIPGGKFSLSFWFRTTSSDSHLPLLALFADPSREILKTYLEPNNTLCATRYDASGNGVVLKGVDKLSGGDWHQVAYTSSLKDGQRLYVDGRFIAHSALLSPIHRIGNIMLVGFYEGTPISEATIVELSELKLFDRVLTQVEIDKLSRRYGVALRLHTQTAASLREQITPPSGEPPFLYKASNYRDLQSLPEQDVRFLIASYNASDAGKQLPVTVWPAEQFNFGGYDGRYGWELFLYMPWLVAQRLADTGDYDRARQWLHCIFDPTYPREVDRWICRPLRESLSPSPAPHAVTDPDAIARDAPIHYRTAIVNAYTDVLMAAGDAQYRNPTRESLGRAKMYYVMAGEVRGPRPLLMQVDDWASPKLGHAREAHFKRPVDEKNLAYWDTLEARLDNLRHNRSIDGLPLNLPLLAPPVNPAALQQAAVSGGTSALAEIERITPIPHYRFAVMLEKARGFVVTLSSLGNALQQTLERDDSEALGLMQLEQQVALVDLGQAMQREQIEMAQHNLAALQHSRTAASERHTYYHTLYEQGISPTEQAAMDLTTSAGALRIGASVPFTIAGVVEALPNIFGLAVGGQQPAGIPRAVGTGMLGVADMLQITADRLAAVEQYRRRSDDWQLQYQQAEREGQNLDAQIAGAQRALAQAQHGLKQQALQQEQARATQRFLQQRFGSRALYRWMSGRLATLYWQAYDGATNLCRQAEAACQYELGNFELRFIQAGQAWNDQFRGLLAGEALLLDLQRMELVYRQRNSRPYEIVKTFSLKAINSTALATLKSTGTAQFELDEKEFDKDYPNHYLRQIKTVALSFPAVLGPYQEVGAMLSQLSNTLYYTSNKDADKNKRPSKPNLRAYQQVALSQGINDSGLFQLDFNDERYLPFEGTGVDSKWKLEFPGWKNESGNPAKTLLESLDDVIIQVRYTATS
ncbi:neuraminidase-like domain-containing protein [Burkholderia sp. GbtcB21]|uniref:Tc toxin subunit A-related protein n=1 Tax=Burkholderia sp. GbtcB21 TaxID=2824766 RepID=UPI001C30D8CB|nr:neuraminidase-like domain-containing protein [Burkholderia sp. GbtcB21]